MTGDQAVNFMLGALESSGIPYVMVGSYASNVWGVERSTLYADFVVQVAAASILALGKQLGQGFEVSGPLEFEAVTGQQYYRVSTPARHFTIDLFLSRDDEFDRLLFQRRVQIESRNLRIWIASAEDVVVSKLRWSRGGRRPKDVDDARHIIAVRGTRMDWEYMRKWCAHFGTTDMLVEVQASIPEIPED